MRYLKLFGKSLKGEIKDAFSINARLLTRAGFIDQLMSGSYTLLPLGLRVVKKIEQIIREEMNNTGAQELLMPLLHPKDIWNETGRWESAKEVMYQFKKEEKEYALSFTHEEIVLDVVRKHAFSYKDYPIKIYHFSTKFRDEPRARSGVLRGREFLMKDLYSLHTTQEDLDKYYWEVAEAYIRVFKRVGLDAKIVEAAGGVFTESHTHEFQVLNDAGEDTIYVCDKCDFAQNKEVATVKEGDKCPKCQSEVKEVKSIEVGNIFRFGDVYSRKMNVMFTDEEGTKQYPYFGSYGIGLTRLMGTLVENFHDDKGIVWPKEVAPYRAHLIQIQSSIRQLADKVQSSAEKVYEELKKAGVEVLFDDREGISAGEKFSDADLIGIPVRLVVSDRTLRQDSGQAGDKIEWKERHKKETELLSLGEVVKRLLA